MKFIFALTLLLGFAAQAQYAITTHTPVTLIEKPEATGGLWKFRLGLQTAHTYDLTYTPDTGPWPPDFSKPTGSDGSSAGVFYWDIGTFKFLDLLVLYSDRLEFGGRFQFLGSPQSQEEPGLKAAFVGVYQPPSTWSDSHSNTCLFSPPSCYPEGRTWSVTESAERALLSVGYRIDRHFQYFAQYYYQRYRSGGQFNKYDQSIPSTFSAYLGGTGEARSGAVGGSFEFSLGGSLLMIQAALAQIHVTSDVAPAETGGQFSLDIGFWFDADHKSGAHDSEVVFAF